MGFGAGSKTEDMVGRKPIIIIPPVPPTPMEILNQIAIKIHPHDLVIVSLKKVQLVLLEQTVKHLKKKIAIIKEEVLKVDTPSNRNLYENLDERIQIWKIVLDGLEGEENGLTEQVAAIELQPEQSQEGI